MLSSTLLAIDAGGTKTDLLWAQPDGTVLARTEGTGINIASTPPIMWREVLENLLGKSGIDCDSVTILCAGVAGYTLPDRRQQFLQLLEEMLPCTRAVLLPDYAIALEGATGGAPGILVIAGTGSIACGRDKEGKLMRAGGWGYLLGDEGSGFWIGREALRSAIAAKEGWGDATTLPTVLSHTLGFSDYGEWLSILYRSQNPQSLLAELAPLVTQLAEEGDPQATRILCEAADHLAQLVMHLEKHLHLPPDFPVCTVGGVWKSHTILLARFRQQLQEQLPHWRGTVTPALHSPVEGALIVAQRMMCA